MNFYLIQKLQFLIKKFSYSKSMKQNLIKIFKIIMKKNT